MGFEGASEPVCYDVDWDGTWEVLVAGAHGEVVCYSAKGMRKIWRATVGEKSLTSVVVGDFAGTGALVVATASSGGTVYFLRATDGLLLAQHEVGAPVTVPPSVAPLKSINKSQRDGVVVCDDNGDIHLVELEGGKARGLYTVSNTVEQEDKSGARRRVILGRITRPVTVSDVTGDGVPEILAGTVNGAVQAFPLNKPADRYLWFAAQGTHIDTSIAAADFFGRGSSQIAFGTRPGDLFVLEFDATTGGFSEVRRDRLLGSPNGHLVVADLDGDGFPDLAAATGTSVVAFEGRASLTRYEKMPYTAVSPPLGPIGVVGIEGRKPVIFSCDSRPMSLFVDSSTGEEISRQKPPTFFPHVAPMGNFDGSGRVQYVCMSPDRSNLFHVVMDEKIDPIIPPIMAYGTNFQRDGQATKLSWDRLEAQRQRVEASLAERLAAAQSAYEAGAKKDARTALAEALAIRPQSPEGMKLKARLTRARRMAANGLILVVMVIGAAGAWTYVNASRRRRRALKVAESASAEGDFMAAIRGYEEALAHDPNNEKLNLALAEAMLAAGMRTESSISVYQQSRAANPDRSDFTLALAESYAAAGNESDEALEAYQVALGIMESGRGTIAFHAGNIMRERGELDKALRYYKIAYGEHYREAGIFRKLTDIYLEMGQFSERTLPVFERIADERRDDVPFMEGLCRCYLAAHRMDATAREAASRMLAITPENAAALRLMARCELQAGHADRAAHFALEARTVAPADADLLELLAHCYMALERSDDEAMALYREALEALPNQPDLLRVVAGGLVAPGSPTLDDEGYDLVMRAAQANAQDGEILLGAAAGAEARGQHLQVISTLERAMELGYQSGELYCRLADAYAAVSPVPPPAAETVLREALKVQADNPVYLRALARLLGASGRTDPDTVIVLEKAFNRDNSDFELGRQLAQSLMVNGRYDEVLKLVRWLLQHDKESTELQKLHAEASLKNNRIDEAIRQYEHMLGQHPDDAEAQVNLAKALAEKQRTDDVAASRYEAALALEPEAVGIRMMFARHHALGGRMARAVEEFRVAGGQGGDAVDRVLEEVRVLVAAAPDRPDLRWFLANTLIETGRLEEAVTNLMAIFEADPSQMKAVVQGYDRVLARDPSNMTANHRKGVLLKAQGQFEEARPLLEAAARANPSNAEVLGELADLYEQILSEKDNVAVRFALAKTYYAMGSQDLAIGQFQTTQQDFRYENESIKMLGLCFTAKGMLDFALTEFKKLVIDEEIKGLLYDLGELYLAKNGLVGAKEVYRILFATDIHYRDVKLKFEMLKGSTSDPLGLESSALMTQLSEQARRRYNLLEEVGRGAMGIVYKAHDNELDEVVALKILPENLSQNPEALMRFRAEARSARRLSHPHIVRIHDIGEEMGRRYISMEYVPGSDLKKYFRSVGRALPAQEVITLMAPLASALEYAHSMGIVHRDVKPANILLNEKLVPKISDFGIAKLLEATGETKAGAVIGTPMYMSPEQVKGEVADERADVYSFGVMMYEMAGGRTPFYEGDLSYQHVHVQPAPLNSGQPELDALVMKCLKKNREERCANMGEVRRALETMLRDEQAD
jgi:tetratricopeptide (TPR) repeat protein